MGNKVNKNNPQKQNLLEACKKNIGEWVCTYCNSGSGQPAAVSRELRADGYLFEETSPGRYSTQMYCPTCGKKRTHIKLLSEEPVLDEKKRCSITKKDRERVLSILGTRDAFTGASIVSSTPEIDHKTPFSRLEQDKNISELTDEQIKDDFQILTRHSNLLKDKACKKCILTNKRTPFNGIEYWYVGDENYDHCIGCVGCGWHDGVKYTEKLNQYIKNKKDLIKTCQEYIKNKQDNNNDYYLYQLIDNILHLEEECGVYDSMTV